MKLLFSKQIRTNYKYCKVVEKLRKTYFTKVTTFLPPASFHIMFFEWLLIPAPPAHWVQSVLYTSV